MFDRREKLFVEIIGKKGIKTRKKFPIESGKIEIAKGRGRKAAYRVDFDRESVLDYTTGFWIFKKHRQKVILMEDADSCVQFKAKDNVEIPTFDRTAAKKLLTVDVIEKAGDLQKTLNVPIFLYILMGALVIMNIFIILLSSGKVRIA